MSEEKTNKRGRPKGTGSNRVYEDLKKKILRLDLSPGTDLDELGLVEEYAVSRTPVREALIRLATDGLITVLANRGARVSPLDFNEIPELLEGLELCLRLTARWAAVRRTPEDIERMRRHAVAWKSAAEAGDVDATTEENNGIHLTIAEAAHNKHLFALYRSVVPGFLRLTHTLVNASPMDDESIHSYVSKVDTEHHAIIDAIDAGDEEAADQLSLDHANLVRQRVSQYFDRRISIEADVPRPNK